MNKHLVVLFFFLSILSTYAQKALVSLEGYAENCSGCEAIVYKIEDYLSFNTSKLAQTTVKTDSTFDLNFFIDEIQKVKVEIGKNYFYLYLQPNGVYDLYVKDKALHNAYRPEGNLVEYFFGGLDSTDINYKTLMFEEEVLYFLKNNYRRTDKKESEFVGALDQFKTKTAQRYKNDSSAFFKNYIRYGIASLDDLNFIGARNKYEKYDFYIKPFTVFYNNDRYMEYILNYYDNYQTKIAKATNNLFYQGVLKASPTVIMQALGNDYSLMHNRKLREVVALKMLSDVYYSPDYPQTNILRILDSLSNHALFSENKLIARNIKSKLLELMPGARSPNYILEIDEQKKSRVDYLSNYHYIQFVKEDIRISTSEIPLLKKLYANYNNYVKFTTILVVKNKENVDVEKYKKKNGIDWDLVVIEENDLLIDQFNVQNFAHYILIDAQGYIVSANALGPKPNGDRKTIENTFVNIKRLYLNQQN
ncbi:MAG: TlpA family protein disulfide reductase [Lishizhenia sp.]